MGNIRLTHVTNASNIPSILKEGLDPKYATMRRAAVWTVLASQTQWSLFHCLSKKRNKGLSSADMVEIIISVPRSWVKKHGSQTAARGIKQFWIDRVVPANRIKSITPL